MENLQLADRPLRYLGLPGTELLDLDVLAELCSAKGVRFRFLGFNLGGQSPTLATTQRLAEDLLKAIDSVDPSSLVATDDILSLAARTSLAYRRLKDFESFDLVNLDLCDVFTTRPGRSVHAAVRSLLEFQINRRRQPWLLFITTVTDRQAVAEQDVQQYRRNFDENSARWPSFRDAATALVPRGPADSEVHHPFDGEGSLRFGKILAVSIGKWLARVLREPTPWRVQLKSCICYRRGLRGISVDRLPIPEPELFSMVFGIDRPREQLADPDGLAPQQLPLVQNWTEAEERMAVQMLQKATRAIDLDVLLQRQPGAYEDLAQQSAQLLAQRNYDQHAYMEFARGVPRLPI